MPGYPGIPNDCIRRKDPAKADGLKVRHRDRQTWRRTEGETWRLTDRKTDGLEDRLRDRQT